MLSDLRHLENTFDFTNSTVTPSSKDITKLFQHHGQHRASAALWACVHHTGLDCMYPIQFTVQNNMQPQHLLFLK